MLGTRFTAALTFATELHGTQYRKGTSIPYVSHLLAVTALVIEHGGDEDQAIAAVLHDAVEDQGGRPTLERIRERFGARVAQIVEACTDADVMPKPPWRQRKESYLATIPHKESEALLIALADKVHNARAILADYHRIGDAVWTRFNGGKEGTLWYYRAMLEAFRSKGHPELVSALEEAVLSLEKMAAERPYI